MNVFLFCYSCPDEVHTPYSTPEYEFSSYDKTVVRPSYIYKENPYTWRIKKRFCVETHPVYQRVCRMLSKINQGDFDHLLPVWSNQCKIMQWYPYLLIMLRIALQYSFPDPPVMLYLSALSSVVHPSRPQSSMVSCEGAQLRPSKAAARAWWRLCGAAVAQSANGTTAAAPRCLVLIAHLPGACKDGGDQGR